MRHDHQPGWAVFAAIAACFALAVSSTVRSQVPVGTPDKAVSGRAISFDLDIRPILTQNCFACHGPDETKRKAKLHFDTREGAFSRPNVIVPGDTAKSRLIQRITNDDPDEHMPPPDSGHALTARQIALLTQWVAEGAKWDLHWAYVAPRRPELPAVSHRQEWVRNPIDRFVLARLEQEGLQPSPEADKATLLRRVTYDLTGLPPTPAEIDAFLADQSPDAYETRVDALLKSPHYGERMAVPWLDTARYADSHGYHIDSAREMWHWRDWVIDAFNRNLPFDEFTVDQLAGDLLPNATDSQKIASGFNRNHMINFEGGAIAAEYQVEYVIDRVEATSTTFMGLTMGCARCHTHKFDPITQKEFYQFFAFFNGVPEEGLDGQRGNAVPFMQLPTDEQRAKLDALKIAIKSHENAVADETVAPLQEKWEASVRATPISMHSSGLVAHYELDGNFSDISGHYHHGRVVAGDPGFDHGMVGKAAFFDGDTEVSFGNGAAFDRGHPFTISVWLKGGYGSRPITAFQKLDADRGGMEWTFDDFALVDIQRWAGKLSIRLAGPPGAGAIEIRSNERLRGSDWHQITLTYDGSGHAAGLKLYRAGQELECEVVHDDLAGDFATSADLTLGHPKDARSFHGAIDDLRIYDRVLPASEIEELALHYPAQVIVSGVSGKPTKEEAERVREYFLTFAAPDALRTAYAELTALRTEKSDLDHAIPTTMVMAEMEKPRDTFVLGRGDYRNQTEKVQPGVPAVLPSLPKDAPLNRLTLARWLVDPSHPLTSRVAVNRFWQMYFGLGLVKTQEDFGVRGDPPSNPALLDWLATEFIRTGWDVRAMQRLIVTSATYRQSSKVTPALLEKDPENRLLARGPRSRLPAEMIRDTALSVGGLLNQHVGGPSVFPYQPAGLWEEMAFGDGFSMQSYVQSHGPDLYRRGLYTFWKRTNPPASLATFDAPDREKCTARRTLTNTPLQALALMNDPTYVEAARALAQRALLEGGRAVDGRIAYAFRLATARRPSAEETAVLRALLSKQLAGFRRDKKAARDLLAVGEWKSDPKLDVSELAAWSMVSSTILNLDETITKE
jgi:hypothetical protein